MEELFVKIGETLLLEMEEISNVEYLNKELGCYMIITTADDKKYILSVIESL